MMKKNELIKYRKLVIDEYKRRQILNESVDLNEIINQALKEFKVTESNGIYVCTKAFYYDWHVCYQDLECYTVNVDIDSKYAERKIYCDIESGLIVKGSIEKGDYCQLITDFESNNIVLNPYNSCKDKNGYEEVRLDFFESILNRGQTQTKKKILSKYPRI